MRVATLENDNTSLQIAEFARICVQLALITGVIHFFEIKDFNFWNVFLVVLGGFAVHSFLPLRFRIPFFILISAVAFAVVFKLQSLWLIFAGLLLIGIAHVKIPFRIRVVILLLCGIVLALMRMGKIPSPMSMAALTFLASMFMFRLIIYLYDLKHDKNPPTFRDGLSYFFLLPNACFAFFPVIDSKIFRRTYYNARAAEIYQSGADWIFKGITHLLIYRLLYHHFTLSPMHVVNAGDLLQYVIVSFLLYIHVSGQFHLIVGILHLFGFNLPKTHYLYYLVPNFAEVWRCLNIYWKDFMMKLFYYPAFFRLRSGGTRRALILSTIYVFFVTCLLHAYQWFWLIGEFPLKAQDFLFWGVLGSLVLVTLLKGSSGNESTTADLSSWKNVLQLSVKVTGTFLSLCVLWSLWNSQSISSWISTLSAARNQWWIIPVALPVLVLLFAGIISLLKLAGIPLSIQSAERLLSTENRQSAAGFLQLVRRPAVSTVFGSIVLLTAVLPPVQTFTPEAAAWITSIREERLNISDTEVFTKGYYEQLIGVERMNMPMVDLLIQEPQENQEIVEEEVSDDYQARLSQFFDQYKGTRITDEDCQPDAEFARNFQESFPRQRILLSIAKHTEDFLLRETHPHAKYCSDGYAININSAGMRDREYTLERPVNTYRMMIVGSSHVFGAGLSEAQIFPSLLEEMFNQRFHGAPYEQYEILNLSLLARSPFQHMILLERTGFHYQPNTVLLVGMGNDIDKTLDHLMGALKIEVEPPYELLRQIYQQKGITPEMEVGKARGLLQPHGPEITGWVYRQIAEKCRAKGIRPVYTFLPRIKEKEPYQKMLFEKAKEAGFLILDISDVYAGHDPETLILRRTDTHPNVTGHRLIADRIYRELTKRDQVAKLFQ